MNNGLGKFFHNSGNDYASGSLTNQTAPLSKSASMPKLGTTNYSIPQNPLPVWVRNPGQYYDISFYPHYKPELPIGQYPMSPEMMKMQILDAKVRNLEQMNYQENEQMKNMLQMNNYLNSMSSMLPYIRGSEPYIQREQRRDRVREEVNKARFKIQPNRRHMKNLSYDEDENDEEKSEEKPKLKSRRKKIKAMPHYEEEQEPVKFQTVNEPSFTKQEEVEVVPKEIAKELQEENHKVRENMILMKGVLTDMKSYLDNRLDILDMKHKIGMETMRSILENTGSKKIIASVRKVMDNEPIEPNDIEEDLHPMIQALPLIMDKKIKESEERRQYEKEVAKREREERRRREEQDKRWKEEDEWRYNEDKERKKREEEERYYKTTKEENERRYKIEEDLKKKLEEELRYKRKEEELMKKYEDEKKKIEEEKAKIEEEKKYLLEIEKKHILDDEDKKKLELNKLLQIEQPIEINSIDYNSSLRPIDDTKKLPLKKKRTKIIDEPIIENITKEDNAEGLEKKTKKKKRKIKLKDPEIDNEVILEKTGNSDSTGLTSNKKGRKKRSAVKSQNNSIIIAEEEEENEIHPIQIEEPQKEAMNPEVKAPNKRKKKRKQSIPDQNEENQIGNNNNNEEGNENDENLMLNESPEVAKPKRKRKKKPAIENNDPTEDINNDYLNQYINEDPIENNDPPIKKIKKPSKRKAKANKGNE